MAKSFKRPDPSEPQPDITRPLTISGLEKYDPITRDLISATFGAWEPVRVQTDNMPSEWQSVTARFRT